MKHKTEDLEGNRLDCAVHIALDLMVTTQDTSPVGYAVPSYSTDWSQGGPIIDPGRPEPIALEWYPACEPDMGDTDRWEAAVALGGYGISEYAAPVEGPTALIAAMRAFVAHKLGDEVDLP